MLQLTVRGELETQTLSPTQRRDCCCVDVALRLSTLGVAVVPDILPHSTGDEYPKDSTLTTFPEPTARTDSVRHILTSIALLIFLILALALGEEVTMDDLVERDGLSYKKFSHVPYTETVRH